MASEIRVNQIQSRTGVSTISFTETGPIISGVTTITGDLDVTGLVSYDDVTNIDSVGVVTARAGVKIPDSQKIFLGNGDDLQIYHNGSHSYISESSGTGDLRLVSSRTLIRDENDANHCIIANSGGSVDLYHNGNAKLATTSNGIQISGDQVLDGHLDMRDSDKIRLGAGDDLQIFHNGSNNYIDNTSDLYIRVNGSETAIYATANGKVALNYDGNNRLETTSTGATITNDLVLNHASGDKAIRWATGGTNKWSLYHNNGAGALIAYDNANNAERLRISSIGHLTTQANNQGNPAGMELRNNNTNAYSHAELALTSQNTTTSKIWCDVPNAGMRLNYNGGTSVKIDQSGNLVMANGAGIDFSATNNSSGSMGSELLDDYEEGTWTPTMGYATSYGTQSGTYVKVGKTVHVWFEIQVTGWSTGTGSTWIRNTPFGIDKVTGCWAAVINGVSTTTDWRIGPWNATGNGLGVWMSGGQGSATSTGIRMTATSFSNYSSLTGSLGTSFTMRGGFTYISTT